MRNVASRRLAVRLAARSSCIHQARRDAIRAAVARMLAHRPVVRLEVVGKLEADGLALTHGRWSLTGTGEDAPLEMSGRGTMVSRRQPDGTWRIVLDNSLSP